MKGGYMITNRKMLEIQFRKGTFPMQRQNLSPGDIQISKHFKRMKYATSSVRAMCIFKEIKASCLDRFLKNLKF